ncbi:MAG TPA: protein-disulfide reductase DsbD [Paucimonas sp.]|nr:protein-disulfide reductase DsbD [Paucimonas sp.]
MLFTLLIMALAVALPAARAADDFLEPEQAFKFSAKMLDAKTVAVTYAIADGYYMYRERFQFAAAGAKLGTPVFPAGKVKFDETFQKEVETYAHSVTIKIPVEANAPFVLKSTGQGCADKGLCYAPMESEAKLNPGSGGGGLLGAVQGAKEGNSSRVLTPPDSPAASKAAASAATVVAVPDPNAGIAPASLSAVVPVAAQPAASADSDMGEIEASLKSGRLIVIVPLFLLLGLGLSFTPCVLPMVPILSSIIVGEGAEVRRRRGFILSATYALGMAIVYTALGVAAGLIGEGLSAALQNPWVLGAFGILMVVLALSMFDVYQLQMPAALQSRLSSASDKQARGKLLGVFAMGAISALIVGPCVAAPLAGALVYISQTRDVFIGGSALFSMAVGMSVPLLLVGLSAGSLLPRAGMWMESVKQFFGVLMLAMALWLVSPVLPAALQMIGWSALGLGYGAYLLWHQRLGWIAKAVGLAFAVLGAVQLAGVATGGRDALAPLAHLGGGQARHVEFKRIKSTADLDAVLANTGGKPVLLDFYADWCVSCKEMEKLTFTDPRVRQRFAGMVLIQADVTANDADDKALLKRFNLFGPPGIILFDQAGREIPGGRVIGYQDADKFLRSLSVVKAS